MKRSIIESVISIVILWPAVSFGSPNLAGQYWLGSLSVDVDTNAPWAKRGTVSITGNQWDQEWDDYNGHHTFAAAFTTTTQPDGSININFPEEAYNVAWNGDVMIHAGTVLHGGGEGIDIFTRKAANVDVNNVLGGHAALSYQVNSQRPSDSCQWYDCTFDSDYTSTLVHVNDDGDIEAETMAWILDDTNAVVTLLVPTGEVQNHQSVFLGQGGIGCTWQIIPEEGRSGDLGYAVFVKKTDQIMTMADIAGTYQVRFLETGPGATPYTCGQGTCFIEAIDNVNGILSVDAYYSHGEHDVKSIGCSMGPGNELHLDDEQTPNAIINQDKNLILIPEWRSELLPKRTPDDRLGGIFLIRTSDTTNSPDGNGDVEGSSWARRVASNAGGIENLITGMTTDSQSNVYVTGWFDGTNNFGGVTLTSRSGGGHDIFVAKYSPTGILQWAQRAGGAASSSAEDDAGRGVGVDTAGNVYVTGQFNSTADFGGINVTAGSSAHCFFLAKYDTNGVVQWVRQNACSPGGCAGDGLAVDATGNCYVVGSFNGAAITFGDTTITKPSFSSVNRYLVKYDEAGVVHWAVGITSTVHSMVGRVCLDRDGSIYVTGVFRSDVHIGHISLSAGNAWNSFVAKLNSSGVLLWAQVITSDSGVRAFDVRADHQGGVYVSGAFGTVAGTTASFAPSVTLTSLGGGSSGANEGDAIGDAFLAKYDATTGNLQWARRAGGTGMDAFPGVTTDAQGNVYTAGGFMSGGDAGEFTVPTNQNWHMVVAKYDPNGTVQELDYAESTGMGLAMSLAVDPEGNRYIAGWYQGLATFGTKVLESDGAWNYFLAKLAGSRNHDVKGHWIQLSSMKTARNQFAGCVIGNEIFVFGGNAADESKLYSGEKYNIVTGEWSDIADNPRSEHPYEFCQLGVEELSGIGLNGKFHVFGARGYDYPKGYYGIFNYNEVYDPFTNKWNTLSEKPTPVSASVPVIYDGEVFFFGGYRGNSITSKIVEAYDPNQDIWRYVTDMPTTIAGKAVAVYGDSAYIIGGYDLEVGAINNQFMVYDFQTNTWVEDYCTVATDAARVYSYATQIPVVNGKAYLVGGSKVDLPDSWVSNKFTVFHIESKNWESGPDLPKPRDSHLTVVSNNTVYVIGGEDDLGNTKDTVFAYTLPVSPDP